MPDRFLNRDLSWLRFNDRVLAEAADPSVPAIERLRFLTIVSSNLDEFFMVRVADLAVQARKSSRKRFPDGMNAGQVLFEIREHVLRQKARQAEVFRDIAGALEKEGIVLYTGAPGDDLQDAEMRRAMPRTVYTVRRLTDPLPDLPSERIHVFVRFPGEYAILTIEDREARLVRLAGREGRTRFALAERWLVARAQDWFPKRKVIEAFPFKILRTADLRYRPDDEEGLEEQILEAVNRRSRAGIIRIEVDAPAYSEGAIFLSTALRVDSSAMYRFDLPLDLRALAQIATEKAAGRLRYPAIEPAYPADLRGPGGIMGALAKREVLLHHPWDSFGIVEDFIRQAAADPAVSRIYHAVYRTSVDSPIMDALAAAARAGKQVTVYLEIKARFDEMNNLRWASELRKAGVRVVRPLGGLKVHSKMTQVMRTEGDREAVYTHLGTGNYHPRTARQYTDVGFMTSDPEIGQDVTACFNMLARKETAPSFRSILVAPYNLHQGMMALIRDEIAHQAAGKRGHIVGKMNSLVDPDIIDALYAASSAGVRVDLWVRGICCLRPGVTGLSQNIRVVSVVDRFLEHSRIYYFRAGGERRVILSSADWMPRNFHVRYEIAFPLKAAALRRAVRESILDRGLADNQKAWALQPDGNYEKADCPESAKPVRSQFMSEALSGLS